MKAPRRTRPLAAACVAALAMSCGHIAFAITLRTVALSGQTAPGTSSGVNYGNLGLGGLNAAGQTAFVASLTGSGVNSINDTGIWSEGSGTLALVTRSGSPAPGTVSGADYYDFDAPVLNAAGQTAFYASLVGPGDSNAFSQGIWSEGSGTLALVARAGGQAPGTATGINYSGFSSRPPALNAAGQTAFLAYLTGSGVDGTNSAGIWSEGSGTLALVARAGSQAPGATSGTIYLGFYPPVLNAAGQTAFYAHLTGSGIDQTNYFGMWSEGSGTLALVARVGSHAPGTDSGVNFKDFHYHFFAPTLNAAGQTAFWASLVGPGISDANDDGIWATDVNGVLQLIVREGNQLEVAPGDLRTVSSLTFQENTGNEDGRQSGFNDSGQVAFWASFVDGSEGIFVSNQVAIPEPASVALLSLGLASLFAVRHRPPYKLS